MTMEVQDFEPDQYEGCCSVCGHEQVFKRTKRAIRETYSCASCRASLREREQARALLDFFFRSNLSLRDTVSRERVWGDDVYEPGTTGALRACLRKLPRYTQSDYYPEDVRHCATDKVPHQDLQALSYSSGSFDLVVTSDILEHVRKPSLAFAEIARILRPGGLHVFTVPMQDPLPGATVHRVDTTGPVDIPLLPAAYHGDGKGGRSRVYTDFGGDIVETLCAHGFVTLLRRPTTSSPTANRAITVVSCLTRSGPGTAA